MITAAIAFEIASEIASAIAIAIAAAIVAVIAVVIAIAFVVVKHLLTVPSARIVLHKKRSVVCFSYLFMIMIIMKLYNYIKYAISQRKIRIS